MGRLWQTVILSRWQPVETWTSQHFVDTKHPLLATRRGAGQASGLGLFIGGRAMAASDRGCVKTPPPRA